jgi:protoporphyrin/coproporphyrin ferrochelatase
MSQPTYDALMLVSFGGPEQMDDVIPFMENVLRGKNVPRERLLEVSEHYRMFGGVSPINNQNRALIAALRDELSAHNIDLPIYWGNRNWHPFLAETIQQMQRDGVKRVLAIFTSAYGSYSSCRQYREDIARVQQEVGATSMQIDKLRFFFNHPGFIATNVERLQEARAQLPDKHRSTARLIFTAHSIPTAMANAGPYVEQLSETCRLVAEAAGYDTWDLVYQSRSGPPHQPWLEPDICDHLTALKRKDGVEAVIVMPIGFISDHMEVIYDLDTEAEQVAKELGMAMARAASAGTHPRFVAMLRELIVERIEGTPPATVGDMPPAPHICREDCCIYQPSRPRPQAAAGHL